MKKFPLPEGWITLSVSQNPSPLEIRLVKSDNAASMVLKELKPIASARGQLQSEDLLVLGNISMQSKLAGGSGRRRILRAPAVVGNGNQFCIFLYSEEALLRRVMVFRTRSTIFELELLQEDEALSFSSVIEAQTAFAKSMMNRE